MVKDWEKQGPSTTGETREVIPSGENMKSYDVAFCLESWLATDAGVSLK